MSHYYKMSHAMMLDEPVGYAFSGPPMQKKVIVQSLEKSQGIGMIIGVVAGVATMGIGLAAMAAAGGIAAMSTLGAISAGAMVAGGAMSAVGAITGNKNLSKVGGILSLAGGIGSAVNNLATGGSSIFDASKTSSINSAGQTVATEATMGNFTEGLGKMSNSFGESFNKFTGLGATPTTGAEGAAATSATIDINAGGAYGQSIPEGGQFGNSYGMNTPDTFAANGGVSTGGVVGAETSANAGGAGILESKMSVAQAPSAASNMSINDADVINKAVAGSQAPATTPATAPAAPSNSSSMMSNVNDAAKLLAGQQKPQQEQGLLSSVMNMSTGSGALTSAAVKAVGDGFAGSAAETKAQQEFDMYQKKFDADQAVVEMKKQNMNSKFEYIDPNDPQAEQKKAAARAAGVIPIMMGINNNAGPVTTTGVAMPANVVAPTPPPPVVQQPTTVAANGAAIDDKNNPQARI